MKKVLHICNIFTPYVSGTTVRINNECLNYNEHIIITEKKDINENIENYSEIDNFKIHRITCGYFNKIGYYLKKYKTITNYIEKNIDLDNVDIIFGHNPYEFAKASYIIAKKYNKKYIYEVHGCMYDSSNNYFRKIMNKFLEKKVLNYADKIVVQTNRMKERISELYRISNDKIEVVYNGVNTNDYNSISDTEILNIKNRLQVNGKKVVGYFGALDKVNGVDRILKAIDKIRDDNVKFVFAGTGPLESDIKRSVDKYKNVIYLGSINNDEIFNYYKILDIFILPRPSTNATEMLVPMKLLEVMLAEVLILASDVNGILEVLENNFAIIFNKNSEEEFIDKLQYLLRENISNSKKLELSENKKFVCENYTWETSRIKLNRILSEL